MNNQSHYEINVSHNGRHLFATHPRSCITAKDTDRVFDEIKRRFPKEEGFAISITQWECTGRKLNV